MTSEFLKWAVFVLVILMIVKFDVTDVIAAFAATLSAIGTVFVASCISFFGEFSPAARNLLVGVSEIVAGVVAIVAGVSASFVAILNTVTYVLNESQSYVRSASEAGFVLLLINANAMIAKIRAVFSLLDTFSGYLYCSWTSLSKIVVVYTYECWVNLSMGVTNLGSLLVMAASAVINSMLLGFTAFTATFYAVKTTFSTVIFEHLHKL